MRHSCFDCEIEKYTVLWVSSFVWILTSLTWNPHMPSQYWSRGQSDDIARDQSRPPSVSFTIYLLLSLFLASWPLDIKRVGSSRVIHRQIQSQWSEFCWLSHSCWHLHLPCPNLCLTWKFTRETIDKFEYFMFPMQKLQGMQEGVWHTPHCGVQVQPRLLAASQVSQVSWARLSQRPGRKEFLHLASL